VRTWCEQQGLEPGALVDLPRLWELARRWYGDRLDLGWRRKTPQARQTILTDLGLVGEFWRVG